MAIPVGQDERDGLIDRITPLRPLTADFAGRGRIYRIVFSISTARPSYAKASEGWHLDPASSPASPLLR